MFKDRLNGLTVRPGMAPCDIGAVKKSLDVHKAEVQPAEGASVLALKCTAVLAVVFVLLVAVVVYSVRWYRSKKPKRNEI